MAMAWVFQGNPQRFDIDLYLASHLYVYWHTPRFHDVIHLGDRVFIWRAGEHSEVVTAGRIAELPVERWKRTWTGSSLTSARSASVVDLNNSRRATEATLGFEPLAAHGCRPVGLWCITWGCGRPDAGTGCWQSERPPGGSHWRNLASSPGSVRSARSE